MEVWKLATHGKHIERDVPKLGGHINPPPSLSFYSSSTSSSSLVSSVVQDAFVYNEVQSVKIRSSKWRLGKLQK